jgi:hypothetical protein
LVEVEPNQSLWLLALQVAPPQEVLVVLGQSGVLLHAVAAQLAEAEQALRRSELQVAAPQVVLGQSVVLLYAVGAKLAEQLDEAELRGRAPSPLPALVPPCPERLQ